MKTYFSLLLVSAVITFALTPVAQWLAFRWGAVDRPDERKIHRKPMARMGGLAVFCGLFVPWVGLYFLENRVSAAFRDYSGTFVPLMLAAAAIFAVGVYDDLKGARAVHKFLCQLAVAVFLYWAGFRITEIGVPFSRTIDLGWLAFPVSVLWIVGITNAINLLDGIDGLVSGVTACLSLALAFINILEGDIVVALITFSMAGAALGFLPYNFFPARIFLGDCGSLLMGVVLACIGMLSFFKAATATFLLVPVFMFGLPLYDTLTVMLGRVRRGQHIFHPDKTHVHHRLLGLGYTQSQAACVLYLITLFLGLSGILLSWRSTRGMVIGIAVIGTLIATGLTAWTLSLRMRNGPPPPRP